MSVRRFDIGELRKPVRMPNGWVRCDGFLTRTGIFTYRDANGLEVRELRPADEVFNADSLASFGLVPVTDDHPGEMLDAKNAKRYTVGSVGEVKRDSDHVRASLLFTDEAAIAKLDSGKRELSCGYSADLEMTPGEYQGQRYDAIQRNIRGNHVALVDHGRAGSAKVRMDTGAAEMVASPTTNDHPPIVPQERIMAKRKITLDGLTIEIEDNEAQIVEKFVRDMQAKVDALSAKADAATVAKDQAQAKADAATAALATEKATRADAEDPAKLTARVNARASLLETAKKHLEGVKLDALTDGAIRKLVAEKLTAEKFDGKSDVYIDARFDAAISSQSALAQAAARAAAGGGVEIVDAPESIADADLYDEDKARKRMLEGNRKRWEKPTTGISVEK